MKRVKVMLMAITVLTVVGSALAFNAAKFNKSFCTKSGATGTCAGFVVNSKIVDVGTQFRGFETTNTADCTNQQCSSLIILGTD